MLLRILFILILILFNGLLAMSEIAIVSVRRAWLQQRASEGDKSAQAALDLATSPNRFLSTVQIGITLVGIFAGAFGGTTLARPLAESLGRLPALAEYSSLIALTVVVVIITFLSVVLGELVPKRLGLQYAEPIAAAVARPMNALARLANPVVFVLSRTTDLVLRMLGIPTVTEQAVSEEEIKVLVEQGTQAGVIEQAERDIVESVFRLGDRQLGSLMTPRTEIVWLDINAPVVELQQTIETSNHSRFPVCDGALDDVIGVVLAKDLLAHCLTGDALDLAAVVQRPLFLPESMRALRALEQFKQSGMHMALLIDEYGGIEGLVTLIDILEALVGDIPTPDELVEPLIVQREDGSWLVDGLLPIDEFREHFQFRILPGEGSYQTFAGFVVLKIGRIPVTGDKFEWNDFRFEVVDMDGNRVDKVLVDPVRRGKEGKD